MIILMGLAGSGKSTQGKMLAEKMGWVWLSAGQVLRDTKDEEVQRIQREGELVDDRVTIPLMTHEMAQAIVDGKGIILDGFPRSVEQAEWAAENIAARIKLIVQIEVPKEELWKRLEARGRDDDKSRESVEERFRIVEENIQKVCAILGEKGVKTVKIDGTGTPEEVFQRLESVVREAGNE